MGTKPIKDLKSDRFLAHLAPTRFNNLEACLEAGPFSGEIPCTTLAGVQQKSKTHYQQVKMDRDTRQRRAIREVVLTQGRPMSPAELLKDAQQIVPQLGLATVYRTVRAMTEEGFLREVKLPGEAPRYEQAGKGHHHHFACLRCGKVFEIDGCRPEVNTLVPPGYVQEFHELTFYGSCASCHAESGAASIPAAAGPAD